MVVPMAAKRNGLPVFRTDIMSSRPCPTCGRIPDSRMGTEPTCGCPWHARNRAIVGTGLLHTAISEVLGVAGGLRFDPGAFRHDVMMTLYDPERGARSEPNGTSCIPGV
jgi:hypothetical protein